MVDWVYTNVVGLRRRKDAVEICQQLMDTVRTLVSFKGSV